MSGSDLRVAAAETPDSTRPSAPGFARMRELGAVLRCYRECFDETQRLRTVADSPWLFRLYYGWLMLRGRCEIAVERAGRGIVGFCIVRDIGDGRWLLTGIGVSPSQRGLGLARRLFGAVDDRRLVLSVETTGPVGFYEKMGLRRVGAKTIVYCGRDTVDDLRSTPLFDAAKRSPFIITSLNRSAFLLLTASLSETALRKARSRLRLFRWAVVEIPGMVDVPRGNFRAVIHETVFEGGGGA